jgi:hypothetical protein
MCSFNVLSNLLPRSLSHSYRIHARIVCGQRQDATVAISYAITGSQCGERSAELTSTVCDCSIGNKSPSAMSVNTRYSYQQTYPRSSFLSPGVGIRAKARPLTFTCAVLRPFTQKPRTDTAPFLMSFAHYHASRPGKITLPDLTTKMSIIHLGYPED